MIGAVSLSATPGTPWKRRSIDEGPHRVARAGPARRVTATGNSLFILESKCSSNCPALCTLRLRGLQLELPSCLVTCMCYLVSTVGGSGRYVGSKPRCPRRQDRDIAIDGTLRAIACRVARGTTSPPLPPQHGDLRVRLRRRPQRDLIVFVVKLKTASRNCSNSRRAFVLMV